MTIAVLCAPAAGCDKISSKRHASGLEVNPDPLDFGTIKVAGAVQPQRSLKLRNTGSATITVKSYHSSCGCTVPEMVLPAEIAPGSELLVPVTLHLAATSTPGVFRRSIDFETDEADVGHYAVDVLANIESDNRVTLQPDYIDFGNIGAWESPRREVRLSGKGLNPDAVSIESASRDIALVLRSSDDSGLVYSVEVAKTLPEGRFYDPVEIKTEHGDVSLYVRGAKGGNIVATASAVVWKIGTPLPGIREIFIRHPENRFLNDLEANCTFDAFRVNRVEESGPGKTKVVLSVEHAPAMEPARGTLRLRDRATGDAASIDCFVVK